MSDVFSRIYLSNGWGGTESRSGPGSGSSATGRVAAAILALVKELDVASVLDVGCGDGYWMPDLPGYVGIDVSGVAIELARSHHPDRAYYVGDIEDLPPPRPLGGDLFAFNYDLVVSRDAMQHLPLARGLALLEAIRVIQPRLLLASTFRDGANVDIATGDAYSPDLTAPPFNMPPPERVIFDGWGYIDGNLVRDPCKFLGLWRL